jgi:2-haloacid dehalogenase
MGPAIEAVVLDLGGVLVDWDPRHLYRRLFPGDEAAMEAFLATVVTRSWNDRLDRGLPFAEGVAELTAEHPDHAELIEAFMSRWPETLGDALHDSVAVLAELGEAGLRRYALSNFSTETFPVARERFGFLSWFDGILLSGEVGLAKPDPGIYEELCRRFGLVPAQTVFVDDSAPNVEAAVALGFRGVRFTSASALRSELRSLGALPGLA